MTGNPLMIVKPHNELKGQGIKIVDKSGYIPYRSSLVVSEYIPNPHLIEGYKYDMRVYVLVTSYNPLQVYIYEEGLVRFSTEPFST